jgi:hypothetical protein
MTFTLGAGTSTPQTKEKMSSQLTSLVPVLDGPNFQRWAPAMRSFLMAQGQWRLMKKGKPTKKVRPYIAAIPATCQEHGIFQTFYTRFFNELFLPFLMFECFTIFILHPHHSNKTNRAVLL